MREKSTSTGIERKDPEEMLLRILSNEVTVLPGTLNNNDQNNNNKSFNH